MWKPQLKDYDKLSIDTYKFIYAEGRDRFEDVIQESESITDKSIKMLTYTAALFGFFVGFLVKQFPPVCVLILLGLVYLIELVILYILISPKEIKRRGLPPDILFQKDLDNKEDEGLDLHITYVTAICLVQDNITEMRKNNNGRITYYKFALSFLVFLIVTTVAFVVWAIYQDPS